MSQFVERQMRLVALAEQPKASEVPGERGDTDAVARRRAWLAQRATPSQEVNTIARAIARRQAIGDLPKAANDNEPRAESRVRKSTGKFVRGSLATALSEVMRYRNTPDHLPEPSVSSWSVDSTATIPEMDGDEDEVSDRTPAQAIDMLLEIEPSIAAIRRAFEEGTVVRGKPIVANKKTKKTTTRRTPKQGPIVKIGNLKFSDGKKTEWAVRRRFGRLEAFRDRMPLGAMLRTVENLSSHTFKDDGASLSNRRLTEVLLGKDSEGNPINWRPFVPKGDTRKGKSLTAAQSRALIAEAIANTPVLPPVTHCPPGVASGTARFSDQFVGVVKASKGKGGAVNWVDVFTARRDWEDWQAAIRSLDPKTTAVLDAALTARNLGNVGVAAGQSESYAVTNGGGKRAMIAANDNLAGAMKRLAA